MPAILPEQEIRNRFGEPDEKDKDDFKEVTSEKVIHVSGKKNAEDNVKKANQKSKSGQKSKSNDKSNEKSNSNSGKSEKSEKEKSEKKKFVHLAPLNMPFQHRLETFGVVWHVVSIPVFCCLFLGVLSLGWILWLTIILPYFIWWYGFDLHTPTNGKVVYRTRDWMKNLLVWEWFVNYFPIKVYKLVDLEPTFTEVPNEEDSDEDDEEDLISESSRTIIDSIFKSLGLGKRLIPKTKQISTGPRYIFGYHPHGVISMGVMGTFGTNAIRNEPFRAPKFLKPFFHDPSSGERVFPGLGNIFPLTLTTQFTLPFYRDYLLGLGLTSALAANIKSLINNGDNSVCIVVGGAQESLLNNIVTEKYQVGHGYREERGPVDHLKKEIQLVLNKRKGFVKLAIEMGNVSLVPIFGFGEVDLYKLTIPEPGSWGYLFQQWMKKTFLFTLPFFSARGVFIYDFGFIPYRNPINMCFGKPIHISKTALAEFKKAHDVIEEEPKDVDEKDSPKKTETDSPKKAEKDSPKKNSNSDSPPKTGAVASMLRTDSFTNLFKLKKKAAPPKTKIPAELLDYYHQLYIDELKRVFEENKERFGYGDVKLVINE